MPSDATLENGGIDFISIATPPSSNDSHLRALYKKPSSDPHYNRIVITSDRLSERSAYIITKIMYEKLDNYFALAHIAVPAPLDKKAILLPDTTLSLHPGALQFYRDIGWITPDPAKPISSAQEREGRYKSKTAVYPDQYIHLPNNQVVRVINSPPLTEKSFILKKNQPVPKITHSP